MEQKKTINDFSIIELKALLFDLDQEVKQKQGIAQQINNALQEKIQAEKNAPQVERTSEPMIEKAPKTDKNNTRKK